MATSGNDECGVTVPSTSATTRSVRSLRRSTTPAVKSAAPAPPRQPCCFPRMPLTTRSAVRFTASEMHHQQLPITNSTR